jgi:hypothetical protein
LVSAARRTKNRAISETSWRVVDQGSAIELDGGFKAGLLYECVYEGKDGIVSGLGFAAVRDFVAFAKHGGAPADELGGTKRAIGFGVSQTGRFLRQFLYEGFNADESGRRVFDGAWADVGGAGRGNFNYRYAQASRDGNAWSNVFYPTDVFPFHDQTTTDAATGKEDGLLAAAEKSQVVPKIFYTNTSFEYWGRAAALIHCTADGKRDEPLAMNTRVYMIAGGQHLAGRLPPVVAASRYPGVPTDVRPVQRALLDALHRWIRNETLPPESIYPKIREGTLVASEDRFLPPVAGLEKPRYPRLARRLDFGPEFERSGVLMAETVTVHGAFVLRVPASDAEGNDRGGIQLPIVGVPLGTILPWNFRSNGGTEHMAHMIGSFLPFARTTTEREARKDPRRAVEERYADKNEYLSRARAAAFRLVSQRLLLESDIERVVRDCDRLWEYVVTQR